MLRTIAVHNYRSLHDLKVPLAPLTVVTGANGTGKTSLYRALRLLADCAVGDVVGSIAREGGLASVLWAGPDVIGAAVRRGEHGVQGTTRSGPITLGLGFASDDFSYLIDLGIPQQSDQSAFNQDPEIKRELIWSGEVMRPNAVLLRRKRQLAELRDPELTDSGGRGSTWTPLHTALQPYESVLTEVNDPRTAPEVMTVREQIRSWRFYDHFRTDPEAPARRPQVGTRTPVLDHQGHHLAAALRTIMEIGDAAGLQDRIDEAFPGARLSVPVAGGLFDVELRTRGLLRPLRGAELSDGTLRYLLLVAALLSPRPPRLMVLNEPETSLHPDLLPPLADLIASASARTQLIVVSHHPRLVEALSGQHETSVVELVKDFSETRVVGQGLLSTPTWNWGTR